jgi:arylsulfatase A-like enzyme
MLLLGLLATLTAKTYVLVGMETRGHWLAQLVRVVSLDIALQFGLAALFLTFEAKAARWRLVTVPVSALSLAFNSINAAYLLIAGSQLNAAVVLLGIHRLGEAWAILVEELLQYNPFWWVLLVACLVALPLLWRRLFFTPLRQIGRGAAPGHFDDRTRLAFGVAAVGLAISLLWPAPDMLSLQHLAGNATLGTCRSWLGEVFQKQPNFSTEFRGFRPVELAVPNTVQAFARSSRPNIVMLVLESTRFDHVEMPDGEPGAQTRPRTPNILSLARQGTWVRHARATVPHTTKALFSILCARLPVLQYAQFEVTTYVQVECLPHVLASAGYQTAFFQSAIGIFEIRPRLVRKFGYEHFESWENVGGEPLGYLASDDLSLAEPFENWLDQMGNDREPFFATLLTSATHHPYRLPKSKASTPHGEGDELSDQQRYALLVEAEDKLLGLVLAVLDERGLRDSTIVVVLGDHGEGFGTKGIKQHDNNFFEEGLHVPLVMAGPGIPKLRVDGNVSLVDVTPSLLAVLKVRSVLSERNPLYGMNFFGAYWPDRPRYFACYFDDSCVGFVVDSRKVVVFPQGRESVYYDLATDPAENSPQRLTPDLEERLPDMWRVVNALRNRRLANDLRLGEELRTDNGWYCGEGKECEHPNSPEGYFHAPPSTFY